jgi:hypothetical protein
MVGGLHPSFSPFGRTPFLRELFAATGHDSKPDCHSESSEESIGMLPANNALLDPSLRPG